MTRLAVPMLLAGLGLPVPALICLAVLGTIRLTRSIGIGATMYTAALLALGILAR